MAEVDKITQDGAGRLFLDGEPIECYCCFDRGYYIEAGTGYTRQVVKDCSCQEKKGETNGEGTSKADNIQQSIRS